MQFLVLILLSADLEGTKVETKGINLLEKELKEYNGRVAMISTSHKLYGDQKLKCKLDYIFDDNRIGFRVKDGQEKFIYKVDLVDCGIKDGIYFADDLVKIEIKIV